MSVSTKIERIAQLAREMPEASLRTLAHHIDIEWLHEAVRRTRKDGAVGVDGETAAKYAERLDENLSSLLARAKSCDHYRAPPVRRVHIPKGDGKQTRPIGIPTYEDKVLQRAVAMVLEAVYEQDFSDCSYGFRPGRSAHQALRKLRDEIMNMHGGWVLEGDIKSFFDSVGREPLRQILQKRIGDGVLLRLIGKWLNAGVMESGVVQHPERGTPQGGVISPILANIFLHEVLDTWFEREVKPRLKGHAHLVRYADDFVIVFKEEGDARRVLEVLPKRFGKYGLELHPDKTRLVPFQRPPKQGKPKTGEGPDTFDLLGFTHYWMRSLKGNWVVKQKTAAGRFSRAMRSINVWCRLHRHHPIAEQHQILNAKLRGHYGYYGVIGNIDALWRLQYAVTKRWCKWLSRRSHAGRLNWKEMTTILERFPLARPGSMRPAHA